MWKVVTLETTLKPFCADMSDAGFARKAEQIFRQWEPLWLNTPAIPQIMLWAGDGSEILEYSGNPSDVMEYARYVGGMQMKYNEDIPEKPESRSIHQQPRLFCKNPPVWHYTDLQRLIKTLRNTARKLYDINIEIGTTFDPGPEFARSRFKYLRHPEILGNMHNSKMFLFCFARLKKDDYCYAAYPDGIPENESFGTFFGKQAQIFIEEFNLDFIWFSNGVGFGVDTWGMTGSVFDGQTFHSENCRNTGEKIFEFWRDFRCGCPHCRIETRGTNMTTGIDLASDAVPLQDIYRNVSNLVPPPNSPWAALNGNFGLELAGMMSRIAELPENMFYPFRFYTHDPWWDNSPWLDRYDRTPHDIYLPLAISRLNEKGKVENPGQLNLLSIDNSYGEIPDQVPQECIPFFLDAVRTAPDQPGAAVWVYNFDEIHAAVLNGQKTDEVFANDNFIVRAINDGLPLNTVVSTRIFNKLDNKKFRSRVLLAPALLNDCTAEKLLDAAQNGSTVIFYGNTDNDLLLEYFGMKKTSPVSGVMELENLGKVDHNPVFSGGGLDLVQKNDSPAEKLFEYVQGSERRVAALRRGNAYYLCLSSSIARMAPGGSPEYLDSKEYFYTERLFTRLMQSSRWHFEYDSPDKALPLPKAAVRLHDNAFYYSIYSSNCNVKNIFGTPDGAPLFRGRDCYLCNDLAHYHPAKFEDLEARIFVQGNNSFVSCTEHPPLGLGIQRQFRVTGLKNARVVFRVPADCSLAFASAGRATSMQPVGELIKLERLEDDFGVKYVAENLNGTVHFWCGNAVEQYFPDEINQVY